MSQRAYRARLSLTPDELELVRELVKFGRQASKAVRMNGVAVDLDSWNKLLDKVERARRRGENKFEPFDPEHVKRAFDVEEDSNG